MNLIYVPQLGARWGDPVNMVVIIWVASNAGISLLAEGMFTS